METEQYHSLFSPLAYAFAPTSRQSQYTVRKYSMHAKVTLQRERGEFRPRYEGISTAGELYLTYRTNENRRVAVLQLLQAERQFPNLYDPRLVELSGPMLRFIGFEPAGTAWTMQEWICELTG